ncbi:MAG: ATPase [Rhodospirillaceae bacterium]|nr:ATPase [Rhodospirillaceae bacterium]MBL6942160.1 ATPase [Rhodospirillales bacterium]
MALPKRFYKDASIATIEGGYTIHLDDKPVRTPLGQALLLPVLPLAEAVVSEWQAQDETINPASMPLCGYANTAIDRIGKEKAVVMANLLHFAETDLLCYQAKEPADLVTRQNEQWQPVLDWAAAALDVHLEVTSGVLPLTPSPEALQAIRDSLNKLDDMTFTAVASIAAATGSIILALAVSENHIGAEQAFELSLLDESFQKERWGEDAEAAARNQYLKDDINAAVLFLSLLRQ